MEPDDKQLLANFIEGDSAALSVLVDRNIKLVYRFAYRLTHDVHDAEDITQETFVKLWRNAHKFDENKVFKTWLLSIAHNTAIDLLRKRKSLVFSDFDTTLGGNSLTETLADFNPLPDEVYSRAEEKKLLDTVLDELSPSYREILVLHHEEGLTFNEIGAILGKPLNTVKSGYHRALLALRKALEQRV